MGAAVGARGSVHRDRLRWRRPPTPPTAASVQASALAPARTRGAEADGRCVRRGAPTGFVNVHFDVGTGLCGDLRSVERRGRHICVPPALARGGELIDEQVTVCPPGANAVGAASSRSIPAPSAGRPGFRFLRDQVTRGQRRRRPRRPSTRRCAARPATPARGASIRTASSRSTTRCSRTPSACRSRRIPRRPRLPRAAHQHRHRRLPGRRPDGHAGRLRRRRRPAGRHAVHAGLDADARARAQPRAPARRRRVRAQLQADLPQRDELPLPAARPARRRRRAAPRLLEQRPGDRAR